jgi:sodium transport system ATP-binding protein
MRRLIHDLRDEGKCVLFSSHVMQEVSALCDVIVIVARGRVVARGTPDELREQSGCEDLEDAFVVLTGTDSSSRSGSRARPGDSAELSARPGDRAGGAV